MASKGGRVPESHESGEHHFHYNREEREALLSEETKRVLTRSKLFTMSRRNMIILADIGVIILFTMIFAPIVLGGRGTVKIDGFKSSLKAYEYDGTVLVSLRVEAGKENLQEAGLVSVLFTIDGSEDQVDELDLLPSAVDKPRVLRAEFPVAETEDDLKVYAAIELNGIKRNLSVKVKKE